VSDEDGIRYNDRVYVVGPTGSGKSTVANHLAESLRCQVLHYDTKDEWRVRDVEPVTDPGRLDWREPVLHFRGDGGPEEAQAVFAECNRRHGLAVVVHELADLCDDEPNRRIPAFQAYVRKGRAHGRGLIGASQRPRGMPKIARTEAQHVFIVLPRLDPDDMDVVARMCEAVDRQELEDKLAEAEAASPTGEHGFVWYSKRSRRLRWSEPLPRQLVSRLTVRSTTVA
jgi:energy-coupling factor transporter ATP-binding protein EcfA2